MTPARRAADRFRSSRFLHGYAKGKASWDPAYPAVAALLRGSQRPLLDVGCGVGLLAAFLRESGCGQPILGIEPDAEKVAIATDRVASHYPGLSFLAGDARKLPAFSGDVVVLDVLHYMSPADQALVLADLAQRIAPGGLGLIRTTFRDSSWRYAATLLEEAFVRTSGWIRGGRCRFPTREGLVATLQGHGLTASVQPMWGRTPFNSHLVTVRKPEAS